MLTRRGLAPWQLVAALTVAGGLALAHHTYADPDFESVNVVSDIQGVAHDTDPALLNPWGLTTGPDGNLHVADDQSGVSTLYTPSGMLLGGTSTTDQEPHAITIPAASGNSPGTPTGIVVNEKGILMTDTTDFIIGTGTEAGPARYLYATKDGAIAAYREAVSQGSAIIPPTANLSATGAGFTGLALVEVTSTTAGPVTVHPRLVAANFAQNKINVFDGTFAPVALTGTVNTFVDPSPPAVPAAVSGTAVWSPFNVTTLDFNETVGRKTLPMEYVLVTYALHSGTTGLDEVDGAGYGYANLFTPAGKFVQTFVGTPGLLNAPWGVAFAHADIAKLGSPLIVVIGNHGDGQINAYAFVPPPAAGGGPVAAHLGTLKNDEVVPLAFDGLWALHFGPKKLTPAELLLGLDRYQEDDHNLYFSAGLLDETHGLVGRIIVP